MKIKIKSKVTINVSETQNKTGIDVSNFETTTQLNELEKSIFDEVVTSLFKQPSDKKDENVWPQVGNPFHSSFIRKETSSGLPSSGDSKCAEHMKHPLFEELLSVMTSERKQLIDESKTKKIRKAFITEPATIHHKLDAADVSESLLSGFSSSKYKDIMIDLLSTTIVATLKDRETTITVDDWIVLVENVNNKL